MINAIIETTHLVMLNMLRTLELCNVIWDDEDRIWDIYLAKVSWAIRSTYHTTLKYTSGELAFNRDMITQSQRLINWDIIRNNSKYNTSIRNNLQENKNVLNGNTTLVIKFY